MDEKEATLKRGSKFYNDFPCCRIRERIGEKFGTYEKFTTAMQEAGIKDVSLVAVRQWCGGYARPDIGKMKDIAAVLECSTDYLLGLTDVKTTDTDIKAICKFTGISENAINLLATFCKQHSKEDEPFSPGLLISKFLESSYFYRAIRDKLKATDSMLQGMKREAIESNCSELKELSSEADEEFIRECASWRGEELLSFEDAKDFFDARARFHVGAALDDAAAPAEEIAKEYMEKLIKRSFAKEAPDGKHSKV